MIKNDKPTTIDDYISAFPDEVQHVLQEFRKIVNDVAPDAEEKISYGIPTLFLNGNLVHFGGYKNHIGFYPGPGGITEFKDQLSGYELSKGTIKFPLNKPLPVEIISRITAYRAIENRKKTSLKKQK
ncbi:hypothetical protein CPT03_05885 [Pedobacter ginsengisoli]|uniref:YdhG-like domain-containing protein n=1 Tax=Pedobacter ginsengisoli TaxID=363852 RepID=A0A2D1UC34_9SPHI|nr:DUF1801 domain-containing protein [Pedobacter ginsengisoli]ATP59156.1 hypothetical protein CPT03_05885 [Pedobacter ginsengisoli]